MNLEDWKISELRPHPKNQEIYRDGCDDEVIEAVNRQGVGGVVILPDGTILSGHRRVEAARRLGIEDVVVQVRDDLREEWQILEALLDYNAHRQKTEEQRIREYEAYKVVETEKARLRMLAGKNDPVLNSAQGQQTGKSRDIAARKAGLKWNKAEKGLAVLKAVESAKAKNDSDTANQLLDTLNNKSVNGAYKAAQEGGLIPGKVTTDNKMIPSAGVQEQLRAIDDAFEAVYKEQEYELAKELQHIRNWQGDDKVYARLQELGYIPDQVLAAEVDSPDEKLEESVGVDGSKVYIVHSKVRSTFNRTNEMVDWAMWTWNPVTGCLHNCGYCYARDIANRFYGDVGFAPAFRPNRLKAPGLTKIPGNLTDREQRVSKNVFTCSMADLFGKWVPESWILDVFSVVQASPQWNFLFLTKFPQRLQEICDRLGGFPDNAWVGTTVDTQARVRVAEKAFRNIQAKVKWLSCEPLLENLEFHSLEMFDWVVIGAQSKSSQEPEIQPQDEWVLNLWQQAKDAECLVYIKENLMIPKQVPW